MKSLAIAIGIVVLAQPVYAASALERFHILLKSAGVTRFDGVSAGEVSNGTKPADLRISWQPGATQAERDQADALAASFDWLDVSAPDPDKFLADAASDTSSVPGAALQYLPLLAKLSNNPAKLKAVWNARKGALTAAQQTALKNYAAAAGMPLE